MEIVSPPLLPKPRLLLEITINFFAFTSVILTYIMAKRVIKVNLGSGPTGINGWSNYDWGVLPLLSKIYWIRDGLVKLGLLDKSYMAKWPEIELVDIRKGIPQEDDSVNYIYCSHVLEHFEKSETVTLLHECYRVMKKNGVMRIVLPDLLKLISSYSNSDQFCREFYGYNKDEKRWSNIFIRGHEWMYDKKTFRKILVEVGFKNIKLLSGGKGKVPDISKLDLKIHEKLSFYYECEK